MKSSDKQLKKAWAFTLGAAACFIAGVLLPAFRLQYHLFDIWVDLIVSDLEGIPLVIEHSLLGGIWELYHKGDPRNVILAAILFSFSILFPVIKLSITLLGLISQDKRMVKPTAITSMVGYLSMLDVFVIAVLVAGFQKFPGGTRIVPLIGIHVFAVSVVLSIVAGHLTKQTLLTKTGENPHE